MIAIEGNTTTLTCPLQGTSFTWFKFRPVSAILQQGAKYGDVSIRYLTIYNVDPYDGGTYLCRIGIQQTTMTVVVRGTHSKLDKCSQTKPINVYALT